MTVKLYDNDSYLTRFDAKVISCEKNENGYVTVLDQTAFFPEEGGQCADKGTIDGVKVTYVKLSEGIIYHYTEAPLEAGKTVSGEIDFSFRMRNMQNHSGEHIISGLAHKLYGLTNVGFHLGEDNVTMDLSGPLTPEDIDKIELLANEAIYKNMPVTAYYPDKEELKTLDYRSKSEIKEAVRIVKIGDLDFCACCAPHVKFTGEIGIIKILSFMKYKGGVRLTIASGKDAYFDYFKKHKSNSLISSHLSVKPEETFEGVKRLSEANSQLLIKLSDKTKQLAKITVESLNYSESAICLFVEDADIPNLRLIANDLKDKTASFGVCLSGNDKEGYKYVIISKDKDVADITKSANEVLSGRGGGRGNMSSGSFIATKEQIEEYFRK
ncbi:MAG: hypothetical protein E7411_00140 [Ruminococcaceae bacterium]|nr:hypothetical protein [Oscillospiraceae bacterium]